MQIERTITKELVAWKNRAGHLPLLLRGARQVGKTSVVRQFGMDSYSSYVEINLENTPKLAECFSSFDPNNILNLISAMTGQTVTPGKTLLFIDEIQEVPAAIQALRYFKEKMPELDVVAAGSLLEFALSAENFKMPVGRVEFLFMHPLSFYEYLGAVGAEALRGEISNATLSSPLPEVLHQKALQYVREYFVIGGMPAVVANYLELASFDTVSRTQQALWISYRADFAKYARQVDLPVLQVILDKMSDIVGQQVKYSKIDPDFRSLQLKTAIGLLSQAGMLQKVYATAASHLPLNALLNYKKYKTVFLDVGLISARSQLQADIMLSPDLLLAHRGALAEQFVGQELLAYQTPYTENELYYWCRDKRNSQAEVDYVIQSKIGKILPVEVKSGKTGRLKSMQVFKDELKSSLGIRISQQPLELSDGILSVPMYMIFKLDELLVLIN